MGAFSMNASINRLGVSYRTERPWTDTEKDMVKRLYQADGPTKLAKLLDRSVGSVAGMAARLGVQRSWRGRYAEETGENR